MIMRRLYRRYFNTDEKMSTLVEQKPPTPARESHKRLSSSILAGYTPEWTSAICFPYEVAKYDYSDFDLEPEQEETYRELSKIAQSEKSPSVAFDILSRTRSLPPSEKDYLPFLLHSALCADELLFGLILTAYPSLLGRMLGPPGKYYAMRLIILMAAILGSSVSIWKRILDEDPDYMDAQWGDRWAPRTVELVAEQGTPELMEFLLETEPTPEFLHAREVLLDRSRASALYRQTRKREMLDVIKKHQAGTPLPGQKSKA